MTLFLLSSENGPLLAADSAIIKKEDRQYFDDAQQMLSEIEAMKAKQQQENEAAAAQARSESAAHFSEIAQQQLTEQLASLAMRLDDIEEQRRSDIAQSAFAAVKNIIGAQPDEQVMQGIIDRLLEQFDDQKPSKIHVHPDMQARLAAHGNQGQLEIIGDPMLGPTDCHLFTASSKLVADLSLQLDTLAERWGADANADSGDVA